MIINSEERWLLPDGTLVGASTPFTLGEIQYLNGVAGLSDEQEAELGIVKMAERPDETLHVATPDLDNPGQWTVALRSQPEIMAAFQRAIEAHIEQTAQAKQYSSAVACASYIADPNPVWSAEAQAFIAWRSTVWSEVYATLAEVQAGERPVPTIDELLADLPAIEWPQG